MNKLAGKIITGVVLALLFIVLFGLASALLTKSSYRFSSQYDGYGKETLKITYNRGRMKMQFIGKDTKDAIVISKQFFGFFLRFGSHYYLYATEQDGAEKHQSFTVRSYYIKNVNKNDAFLISDQRGVFVAKNGKLIHLNSVLIGTSSS